MQRSFPLALALLACAVPASGDFRISPADAASHAYPSICRQTSGDLATFVAAWETVRAGRSEVTVQRLDSDGRPLLGGSARANQSTGGDRRLPDLACRPDGTFFVVWEARDEDGAGFDIYGRNFAADGDPAGDEFRINTHTADHQRAPRVCVDGDGRAIVVWSSFDQDGDGDGIFGQRFDAGGQPVGDEFRVNDDTAGNQNEPTIACAASGDHLVAWKHRRADNSGTDIHARRFGGDGEPDGGEFRVNDDTIEGREHPAAAALPGGGFAVAYTTIQSDMAGGVSLRRIGEDGSMGAERTFAGRGRYEAPAVDVTPDGNLFLVWSAGSVFDFDLAGIRLRAAGSESPLFVVGRPRQGTDGAISTLGRGLAIANDVHGDLVIWQKREVFEADSSSAVFAQRFEPCGGDCSGDGVVRINELIQAVLIALGQAPLSACGSLDRNGTGTVEITELIRAVNEALGGVCPAPVN